MYRIVGNLAVWWSMFATAKLKSANISYLHIYIWRSLTKSPNLNPHIFFQWLFWAQPPNLIPPILWLYSVRNLRKSMRSGEGTQTLHTVQHCICSTHPYRSSTGRHSLSSLACALSRNVMYSPGVDPMKLLETLAT